MAKTLLKKSEEILAEVRKYCYRKGYKEGHGVNNFVPHDCVAAFQMAKLLTRRWLFDRYIVVAPEGHIYSFFFVMLGAKVLELFVDYPPTQVREVDDLSSISGEKVLLIEDDVISGATLRIVLETLSRYSPHSVSLYLGHMKSVQHLDNIPHQILRTYLAEDYLLPTQSQQYIKDIESFWSSKYNTKGGQS